MKGFDSYTKFENQIIHKYRDDLNHCESVEDVKKFFSYSIQELLTRVFSEQVDIQYDDIQLTIDGVDCFTISQQLKQHPAFVHAWENSDLPIIINRLAESAVHRFRHLAKHPEKTNLTINRH